MTVIDFNQWGGDAPRAEIDYPTLAALALSQARSILEVRLPGGTLKGREYVCASTKGGKGSSCSTNITTGAGSDFASGEAWGDLIDMVSKCDRIPMHEAAAKIAHHIGADLTKPLPSLPPIVTVSPEEKYLAGRENALRLLEQSVECPPTHEYLARKGVKAAQGVVFHKPTGNLLIPLYDEQGQFWSVQRIPPDGGTKKINDGGRLSGNMFVFQGNPERVYLGEGYATTATVYELTGSTSVMGISSGNLPAVAESLARMYPTSTLIIAGDADDAGRKCAAKAIERAPRFRAIFPPVEGQDWNDLYAREGAEAVRAAIDAAMGTGAEKTGPEPLCYEPKAPLFASLASLLANQRPQRWLVKGLIESPSTVMVFGPSGSGKSFITVDLAGASATSGQWAGHAVMGGPVYYIAGEGRIGLLRRFRAWQLKRKATIPEDQLFLSVVSIELNASGAAEVALEVGRRAEDTGEPPALIIVDTLSRMMPAGNDENSAKDMMAFVKAVDQIRDRFNCVAVIVHHAGMADDKRARGSTSLKAAMDAELCVTRRGAIRTAEWTKLKDLPDEPHPQEFALESELLGQDEDGKLITSAVVAWKGRATANSTTKTTKTEKFGLSSLQTAITKGAEGGNFNFSSTLDAWRAEFYSGHWGDTDSAKEKAFYRVRESLADKNLIVVHDGLYFLPDKTDKRTNADENENE